MRLLQHGAGAGSQHGSTGSQHVGSGGASQQTGSGSQQTGTSGSQQTGSQQTGSQVSSFPQPNSFLNSPASADWLARFIENRRVAASVVKRTAGLMKTSHFWNLAFP